jgi:type III pantothenate kinase
MAIQSGLYYSQIGAAKELIAQVINEYDIPKNELIIIGTGGFASMLNASNVFDEIIPDLILQGLYQILFLN